MARIIIDGSEAVFGRVCSFVAKKALSGYEIEIVNSEKVIITGNRNEIVRKYNSLVEKGGHSLKGPKILKTPYRILKRGIRGMLPDFRRGIGRDAFKKVKCHNGVPEELKDEKMIKINAPKKFKYIELGELCDRI